MPDKDIQRQVDFSGGQINPAAKRRGDMDIVKSGARQMVNLRIEAVGSIVQRPGRTAVYPSSAPRVDYVRMSPSHEFHLAFSSGQLQIFDTFGNLVASNTSVSYLWTNTAIATVNWVQAVYDVVIFFAGMQPQIARWDPIGTTWSFLPYAFRIIAGQTQEPFYRFSVLGATMKPSALTGSITLACSQAYFKNSMVGSVLSILGQQVVITAVTSTVLASATVLFQLAGWIRVYVQSVAPFVVGQEVQAQNQAIKFEVGTINSTASPAYVEGTMVNNLIFPSGTFTSSDTLISPIGSSPFASTVPAASTNPQATVQWQEEFMSAVRGWPQSGAYDVGRLIMCDFPQMPEAILWSAISAPDVCWVDETATATNAAAGALATSAILEFVANKPRVRYVVGWGDEFVFTDRGIYFIPLSVSVGGQALEPGSVAFRQFSNDGVASIRPLTTQDAIVYINAGATRASIVKATGSYTRPYVGQDVSEAHQPLFTGPIQMAIATGDGTVPERYVYVANADGTLVVGKFTPQQQLVGWVPWTTLTSTSWVTAAGPNVWFTEAFGGNYIVETEDFSSYLDGGVLINSLAAGMVMTGKGPLWHLASQTVTVLDGAIDHGDRQVDVNGNLILISPTDDLSSATIKAGLYSPCIFEPFVPSSPAGPSRGQGQKRRRMPRVGLVVEQSNGFTFGNRTIPPVGWDEDPTQQPVLRETTYRRRFLRPTGANANQGRGVDFDPQIVITKDRAGPFRIVEINFEVDV